MTNLYGKTAMIVDDASFMRKMLRRMFERANIKVVAEAENGESAVEQYQTFKPDIVTMDIVMPQMDGISALKAITEIDAEANIVMVSSAGLETMIANAKKFGAHGFIIKPFKEENVLKIILASFDEQVYNRQM